MKSNAPWSVKGIEKDARETAKAAAQREGMTVGEWLSQVIYSSGDPDAAASEPRGDIEGLRARDLAAAIEHLSRRISSAESKSAAAMDALARSLGGAVERLQRLERAEPGAADAGLADRVRLLEEKSTDRQRIEALKALERAVGQIAVQFDAANRATTARLDGAERQLQDLAGRLDDAATAGGGHETVSAATVREAIEGMAERVARAEKIAAEAAQLKAEAGESVDADFIHKTGIRLRILGDEIKRGGDQIRTLEQTISRLGEQIDAAERRSAEGVQKVAETISDLKSQFASADAADQGAQRAEIEAALSEINQRTDDRIQSLQESFDAMVRRLEEAGGGSAAAPAAAFAAARAPRATSAPAGDLDSELDDAFAALDLEEPIPTPAARAGAEVAAPAEVEDGEDALEFDEFSFGSEATPDEDAPDAEDAGVDAETENVLAEIREAFGLGDAAANADDETEDAVEAAGSDADLDFDDDETAQAAPPIVDAVPPPPIADAAQADYLKEARRAAREAAARAAEEDQTSSKKKLTPKQRAILAARLKRRKLEEATARKIAEPVVEAPAAADDEEEGAAGAVKARVKALVAKIKLRPAARKAAVEPSFDAFADAAPAEAASPNLMSGANAAIAKLKKIPNAGGVAGLGAAIILLLGAAFFTFKDFGKDRGAERPAPRPQASTGAADTAAPPAAETAVREDRIAPSLTTAGDQTVRPRDLYLDNIAALKSATTDAEARAALTRIEEAAALGHPPAQLQIGELYKLGQLYDRDLGVARQWFERAANGGNVLAMHRLGVMSARGEGGPVDPAASVSWFEKAAGFGLVDSQYNLGATYHPTADGAAAGVQANIQDRGKAYFWYSIAAKNGDEQAGEMAAGLAAAMPPAERSAKDAEVAAWAAKTPDAIANELAPAT